MGETASKDAEILQEFQKGAEFIHDKKVDPRNDPKNSSDFSPNIQTSVENGSVLQGLPASPGAAMGKVVFCADEAGRKLSALGRRFRKESKTTLRILKPRDLFDYPSDTCACTNIYIYIYIYIYTHIYIHTHTYTHTHTYIYIDTFAHTHKYIHTCIYTHVYTHMYVHILIYCPCTCS